MDANETKILQFPPPDPGYTPGRLPFFVVGIGASAGGIDAIKTLLETMPSDNGMAFVIVIHLSPKHESHIDAVLQPYTKMHVMQVTETIAIEKNHVYVISPAHDLIMTEGNIQAVPSNRPPGRHISVDSFLRTLAEVHRERAVGIILSGAGSDGTVGIGRLKETGGITIAQTPSEAEYDSMPISAINSGAIDLILPVADMAQKLIELSVNGLSIQLPEAGNLEESFDLDVTRSAEQNSETALRDVMSILHARTGHDFNRLLKNPAFM